MWKIWMILTCLARCSIAHVSFTNLKCNMIDKKFGSFEICHIKAVNRTHKYIDVNVKLNILPINNIMHDLIVDHLWTGNMDSDFSKYIPIMNGDYAIFTEWSAYNIVRAVINLYIRISNSQ
ncbi:hypothetical protein M5D96_005941 [Drosophila gunungcola]|uniref:Uncharacterized protein n=1 Tax=Drosophila gunungcola TaxID=103775 RepID=A0A9Q0BRN1_9MUSC|nr:hypothetical protein M5D96_005941 [Drosophila gunungcola]